MPQFVAAMVEVPADQRTLTAIVDQLDGYDQPTQLGPTSARLEAKGVLVRGRPYTLRYRVLEAHLTGNWPATTD